MLTIKFRKNWKTLYFILFIEYLGNKLLTIGNYPALELE